MKIFCIGRNYAEHALELGNKIPDEPVIFMKPKNALITGNIPFYYPEITNELHYECEIVLQVGKNGKFISERNAPNYINGVSLGIDFTARDIQEQLKKKGLPWEKAKAFDHSAFLGKINPVGKTFTEVSNFQLIKNGTEVQNGLTSHMLFSFSNIIHQISKYFTINIGDLIFTGTPAGVGECIVGDELEGILNGETMFNVTIK